jgi:hypothetical protein
VAVVREPAHEARALRILQLHLLVVDDRAEGGLDVRVRDVRKPGPEPA